MAIKDWTFNGIVFDPPKDELKKYYGFVYEIENIANKKLYIGRKYFWSLRKQKGKDRRATIESDWKNYYGSSPILKEDVKKYGKENFVRRILYLAGTKGDVNYLEVKELFKRDVLENDIYYNDNINGKWFKKPQHIIEKRNIAEIT